ncbi:rhodanese-like domain-containing protein [Nesterenkonia halophila]
MSDFETVRAADVPDGAALLDVREDYEYAAGHAPGALHIPVGQIPERFAEELDPDEDTYVVCRTGGRAVKIAEWLTAQGYAAIFVGDGMGGWLEAGRPLEADTGEEPAVL